LFYKPAAWYFWWSFLRVLAHK